MGLLLIVFDFKKDNGISLMTSTHDTMFNRNISVEYSKRKQQIKSKINRNNKKM